MGWLLCSCGKVLCTRHVSYETGHLKLNPDHYEVMRWTFGGRDGYKKHITRKQLELIKPLKPSSSLDSVLESGVLQLNEPAKRRNRNKKVRK